MSALILLTGNNYPTAGILAIAGFKIISNSFDQLDPSRIIGVGIVKALMVLFYLFKVNL